METRRSSAARTGGLVQVGFTTPRASFADSFRLSEGIHPRSIRTATPQPRHENLGCGVAVRIDLGCIPSDRRKESAKLTLGVVKPTCTSPPVRAAEDRLVSVLTPHATELTGYQIKSSIPFDLDEGVHTAPLCGSSG